jgi:hypothetical protein
LSRAVLKAIWCVDGWYPTRRTMPSSAHAAMGTIPATSTQRSVMRSVCVFIFINSNFETKYINRTLNLEKRYLIWEKLSITFPHMEVKVSKCHSTGIMIKRGTIGHRKKRHLSAQIMIKNSVGSASTGKHVRLFISPKMRSIKWWN